MACQFQVIDTGTNEGSELNMDNTIIVAKQLAGKSWLHFRIWETIASIVYQSEE